MIVLNGGSSTGKSSISRALQEILLGIWLTYGVANRRRYFAEHSAASSDHGTHNADTLKLGPYEASALFEKGMAGTATFAEGLAFEAHMMYQQAVMAVEDGLDTGHDIPFGVDFSTGLQPLLADFGEVEGFHFTPFTIDETVFSREVAPLAGFYPSVFVGGHWWFLDALDAMLRFTSAVTETTGFSRSSGFIDDTCASCSIPVRYDASRRVEAAFLARLVAEHRLTEERAAEVIVDLGGGSPRRAFKL